MIVSAIEMRGFMSHVDTRVELPERGVVLVTGPNGAGKSSLVEAVSVAAWGKTLRGTDPWAGKSGAVSVVMDGIRVTRTARKGAESLKFAVGEDKDQVFDSASKAQAALETHLGAWDVWRTSSVFSSSDAALFSLATDGDRKRFLERILGVERFDPALEACRAELRSAEREAAAAEADLRVVRERIAGAERRLADAVPEQAGEAPPADATARLAAFSERLAVARKAARDASEAMTAGKQAAAAAVLRVHAAEAEAARLAGGTCPTCAQPIPATLREALAGIVADATAKAAEARALAKAREDDLTEQIEDARAAESRLSQRIGLLQQQMASHAATERHRAAAAAALAAARADLANATEQLQAITDRAREVQARTGVLRETERVLGLKGVRAHILGQALAGLEGAVNAWLSRLAGPDFRVAIGGEGSTAIDITGAGGGHGYRAASMGERRRIDVALLLGLGEFAAASAGAAGGLLVLDEVLDALDTAGLEAATRAVEELAEERCVIVISHLDELVTGLRPVMRLRVDSGRVEVA